MSTKTLQEEVASKALALSRALAAHTLVKAVVNAVPPEVHEHFEGMYPSGYCANATIVFSGPENLGLLMKAFPPEPCVMIAPEEDDKDRFTVKPKRYLRNTDGPGVDMFPVHIDLDSRTNSGTAIWWAIVGDNTVVVNLTGFSRRVIDLPTEQITGDAGSRSFKIADGSGTTIGWPHPPYGVN